MTLQSEGDISEYLFEFTLKLMSIIRVIYYKSPRLTKVSEKWLEIAWNSSNSPTSFWLVTLVTKMKLAMGV